MTESWTSTLLADRSPLPAGGRSAAGAGTGAPRTDVSAAGAAAAACTPPVTAVVSDLDCRLPSRGSRRCFVDSWRVPMDMDAGRRLLPAVSVLYRLPTVREM